MKWTPDRIELMMAMLAANKTTREVGAVLGCSRNAIIGKAQRERIRRGIIPVRPSDKPILEVVQDGQRLTAEDARNTVAKRVYRPKKPAPQVSTLGVGFLLPVITKPSTRPSKASVGILDVTGCRWVIGESDGVIGGKLFCDAPQREKSSYCAHHAAESCAEYSRELIRRTIRSVVYSIKKGRAA